MDKQKNIRAKEEGERKGRRRKASSGMGKRGAPSKRVEGQVRKKPARGQTSETGKRSM